MTRHFKLAEIRVRQELTILVSLKEMTTIDTPPPRMPSNGVSSFTFHMNLIDGPIQKYTFDS